MKVFDDKHIKNVAFVGAHKSGKTTLSETMLFEAGLINRRGNVESKNTVSDYHPVEHEREASVFATPLHTEWRNYKINIIDTPGLDDFIGEITSTMRVADTVATVINAQHGFEVGTEIIWNFIDKYNKPTLFVVNQIDHPKANFDDSLQSIVNQVGNNAVVVQYPTQVDGQLCIVDVLKMKIYKFGPEGGKPEKLEINQQEVDKAQKLHNELVEKAAENDEGLMELFFEKGSLNEDQMRAGIKKGMLNHELFPVFCVSALNDMGTGRLMGFIDNVAPAAADLKPEVSQEEIEVKCDVKGPQVLFIFKTIYEANLGQVSFFKVKSGEIKQGDKLTNANNGEEETLNQLFIMDGAKRQLVHKLTAGDIGATLKLKHSQTSNTLYTGAKKITLPPIQYPQWRIRKAVFATDKHDEEKLSEVMKKIQSQDPTIVVNFNPELKQLILSCQGELHLSVIEWVLTNEYKMHVEFKRPKIAYRETIQRTASASYRHKKQSGGSGQYAEVHLKIEPYFEGMPDPVGFNIKNKQEVQLDWGGKLVYYNCIVGGAIDTRFIPSILKGVMEVMEEGPVTGSYVRDIRVMVHDGKMHSVDSNDISFKIAGGHAFKEAFLNASPKLMEPIQQLNIKVPDELLGEVMTDLQSRRSLILGISATGKYQQITAKTPLAELHKFSSTLRSLTQGKATFTSAFADFEPVPPNIQDNLIKKGKL